MTVFRELEHLGEVRDDVLVFAAGFEARAFAFARGAAQAGSRFRKVACVEYMPASSRNRIEEARLVASTLAAEGSLSVVFDRFDPSSADGLQSDELKAIVGTSRLIIDVSGMSRFLVCVLVVRALRSGCRTAIVYTEPETYHPTPDEFTAALSSATTAGDLMFLTSGLYGLTAVDDLTTATMQGYPEVLVASPSFEPRFLRALLSELAPARYVLLEGIPRTHYGWRREAVRRVNDFAFDAAAETVEVATDSIADGAEAIWTLYRRYKYTHRFVLAPAPSKLVAVGQALAIAGGVQAEVVYPAAQGFSDPYSEGVGQTRYWTTDDTP